MNYLAHAFLSSHSPQAVVGGLLGDFVKGKNLTGFEIEIADNIRLHRKIDSYTDRHPIFIQSKSLISASRRRYSGVLVDLFYDHFLARHWKQFSSIDLPCFTEFVYASLDQHYSALPLRFRDVLPYMKKDDWLASYVHKDSIRQVINKISSYRIRRANTLVGGDSELIANYEDLEQHFLIFFPQLIQFVHELKHSAQTLVTK